MNWIEHICGVLAMVTCFVLSWGYVGLLLIYVKAVDDTRRMHEQEQFDKQHTIAYLEYNKERIANEQD